MKNATKIAVVLSVAILGMASCSSFYTAHSEEYVYVPVPSAIVESVNQRYKKDLCREVPELHAVMKKEWPTKDYFDLLCWRIYFREALAYSETMRDEVLRQQTK